MFHFPRSLTALGPRYTKPGRQAEKTELTIKQKEYSDDGLSGYTVSSLKAVRLRYILFVSMVSSVFIACSPGLVYLGPLLTRIGMIDMGVREGRDHGDVDKSIVFFSTSTMRHLPDARPRVIVHRPHSVFQDRMFVGTKWSYVVS